MSKKVLLEFEKLKDLHSGLGQFCFHLGKQLSEIKTHELKFLYFQPEKHFNLFGKQTYINSAKIKRLHSIFSPQCDLWHMTHQDSSFKPPTDSQVILTIHDLNFLFKQHKNHDRLLKKLQQKINRASIVTFISNYTKETCFQHLDFSQKKTEVIYNGISLNYRKWNNDYPRKKQFKKFLFSIGIISAKKNFSSLIPFMAKLSDYELVIAGRKNTSEGQELENLIRKYNLENRVHLIGNVSEDEKIWYYEHCEAFIFPSTQEGFGMPVIEAMTFGKPVFVTNSTSLPEVAGPHGYYFENFEPSEMEKVFENGMDDYAKNSAKKKLIIDWTKKFSWEDAAQSYFKVYKSL